MVSNHIFKKPHENTQTFFFEASSASFTTWNKVAFFPGAGTEACEVYSI